MKKYDDVRVINDNPKYAEESVFKGMIGYIAMAEIRNNKFFVVFIDENFAIQDDPNWFREHYDEIKDDKICEIHVKDLELVKDNGLTDEEILEELPKQNPKWWCKVEDGYIINLLGQRKNKVPYDYNS